MKLTTEHEVDLAIKELHQLLCAGVLESDPENSRLNELTDAIEEWDAIHEAWPQPDKTDLAEAVLRSCADTLKRFADKYESREDRGLR